MKLAQIILPNYGNDGKPLADVHHAMQEEIINLWGGYTATKANGAWRCDNIVMREPVTVYTIAMSDYSQSDEAQLRNLARGYGRRAMQRSVMIQTASGDAYFIDIEPIEAQG